MSPSTARKLFVFFGPSGAGKSTLLTRLFKEYPDKFGFSVSHTTRKPREGEEDGVHYHYTSVESMKAEIAKNTFVEHAIFSGNHYGTSFNSVRKVIDSGKICVLDIDVQGVQNIKKSVYDQEALYIFVKPPSLETLEMRLRSRKTDTEEAIQMRLNTARGEVVYGDGLAENEYTFKIVNDDLDRAYGQLRNALAPHLQ